MRTLARALLPFRLHGVLVFVGCYERVKNTLI